MTAASPPATDRRIVWTLDDRLRKIRRELGLNQAEFAEKLGVGRSAYAAWEAGRNTPRHPLAFARRVELVSGVRAAWLLDPDVGGW